MKKHLKCMATVGLMALFMGTVAAAPQTMFQDYSITAEAADQTYGNYTYRVESNNTVTLTKYKGSATVISDIPTKIGGRNVTKLEKTFRYCQKITKVTIPSSITEIGLEAFNHTTALTSVVFNSPDKIKIIGEDAFYCSGIQSIRLGKNVATIDKWAFASCENLQEVYIQSVCDIKDNAFNYCTNLTSFSCNKDIILKKYALNHCNNLENVDITDYTFKRGFENEAFNNFERLTKIRGESITKKKSNGEPYFLSSLNDYIQQNWAKLDCSRIGFYTEYLDAEVAYIVKTQTSGCKTNGQKIKKLHDWVINKVDYSYANGKPDEALECHVDSSAFMQNNTVCDGYARALVLLLRKANIEAHYVVGYYGDEPHAWVIAKLGNYYFQMDPTNSDRHNNPCLFMNCDDYYREDPCYHDWYVCEPCNNSRINLISSTTPKCLYTWGDVNKNGMMNGADKKAILNHIARIQTIPSNDIVLADMDFDGAITVTDAMLLNVRYGKMGDAFTDDIINQSDVQRIRNAVRGETELTYRQRALADVNYDGKVTMEDANLLEDAIRNDELYLID